MESPITPQVQYIKVKEIETALSSLWEKHRGENLIHASLFNLVIYVKKDLREAYLQDIGKTIIRKYPCRMIVVTEYEHTQEEFLRAYVTDLKPDEKSTIFCDLIHFEVSESYRERIPFVLLPHLLPERPVYLLWGDDPLKKDPVILKLESRATRTIFDSESSGNLIDFAKMILAHQKNVFCDIADLNWARNSSWRDLFANAFNSPEKIKLILEAKNIIITYNTVETESFSHTKIQSIYFQGWLATKLEWKLETVLGSQNEIAFKYSSPYGGVTVTLAQGKNNQIPPGRILSVDLYSHHNERINLVRDSKDGHRVAIHHCSAHTCNMPTYYLLNNEVAGNSMMREIYNQGTDPNFLNVLQLISSCKKEMLL